MRSKAKRIAVIGAGLSGIATAKHLEAAGLEVVVFERSSKPGGIWLYDERRPPSPTYPSEKPSVADLYAFVDKEALEGDSKRASLKIAEYELLFAPPGPAYNGLMNNNPVGILNEMKGHPWKDGLPDNVNVRVVLEYLISYMKAFDVERLIKYNTRVMNLKKRGDLWEVQFATLIIEGSERGALIEGIEEFDAVVVATGHYHHPRVPAIPGLKEWKDVWPNRIQTSKSYRRPEVFADQTILLIGSFISSTDIAKELGPFAKHIYQSNREGSVALPAKLLPGNTERITGIASFGLPLEGLPDEVAARDSLKDGQCIPASVTLVDGRVITNIDHVISCTGYHHTYPFLSSWHDDSADVKDANETVLVTDGTQVHNLYKEVFYIPDPTLAFVGIPTFVASFTFFEYQAMAVAAVFCKKALLPSETEMRKQYEQECRNKRPGRAFHSMFSLDIPLEVNYVQDLIDWLNADAEVTGGKQVEGHSEQWHAANKRNMERLRAIFLR
ncbi:hypothetical protein BP6252_04002 [Coleophoma cylindrospora]|uniref:FAD protein n=1 Tax=Coleophoma cylindrospora TaxID=1849047 RepID=A0A3D8RZT7_9HELO|nr:hypothetical protein BP6252_04002 [Coleophoma cylindrospora]